MQVPVPFSIVRESDGQRIEGRIILLRHRDIEVEITSPYQGMSHGQHIPLLAGASGPGRLYTLAEDDPQSITETGWQTARYLLSVIYRDIKSVEGHEQELLAAIQRIRAEQEAANAEERPPDVLDPDAFRAERLKLRARFRSGELDQRQFGREMQALHARRRAFKKWIFERDWSATRAFMDMSRRICGRSFSLDAIEQIVAMLLSRQQGESPETTAGS